ncbi:hypothetical protein L1887_59548 [Cichorium endivia]|nr:hypothetical protein L1887_59548 [Cichorium endivia]
MRESSATQHGRRVGGSTAAADLNPSAICRPRQPCKRGSSKSERERGRERESGARERGRRTRKKGEPKKPLQHKKRRERRRNLARLVAVVDHLVVAHHLFLVERRASDARVAAVVGGIRSVERPRALRRRLDRAAAGAQRGVVLHRLVRRRKVGRRCHARLRRHTGTGTLEMRDGGAVARVLVVHVVDVRVGAAARDAARRVGAVKHVVAVAALAAGLHHAERRVGEHRVACVGVEALAHAVHVVGAERTRALVLRGAHEHLVVVVVLRVAQLVGLGVDEAVGEARAANVLAGAVARVELRHGGRVGVVVRVDELGAAHVALLADARQVRRGAAVRIARVGVADARDAVAARVVGKRDARGAVALVVDRHAARPRLAHLVVGGKGGRDVVHLARDARAGATTGKVAGSVHVARGAREVGGGAGAGDGACGAVAAGGPVDRDPAHALVHVVGPVDGLVVALDVEATDEQAERDAEHDERADDGGGLTGGGEVAVFEEGGLDRVGELAKVGGCLGLAALVGDVVVGDKGGAHGVGRVPGLVASGHDVERDGYGRVVCEVATPPARVELCVVELCGLGDAGHDVDGEELVGHGGRVDVDVDLGDGGVEARLVPLDLGDVGHLDLSAAGGGDIETTGEAVGRVVDGGGGLALDDALGVVGLHLSLLELLVVVVVVMHVAAGVERHGGQSNSFSQRCRPGLCDETSRKESVRAGQRGGEGRGDEEVGRERNAMVVGTRQAGRQTGWRATMACSRSDDDTKGAAGGGSSAKSTKEASKGSNKQKSSGRKTGSTGLSLDRSLSGLPARVCSRAKRSTTICLEQSRQGAGGAAALSRHANGASPLHPP